ncbi:hypothetical protein P43SY_008401 [Pythium insidiosum]|uniref:HIG1 domain-containing protein n=1 Tax=Pythium insidiosum TaxID=114742 RepID=A0AAD5M2E5_PYTIN|nr:hypothetical protein P43SY_008401 [Pythium insidiosum]
MASQPIVDSNSSTAKDIILVHALTEGIKAGATAAAVVGTGVITAHNYWPAFRTRLGASGKTALVVSSLLATFAVVSEKRLLAGARNPEKYLASLDPNYVELKVHEHHSLKWYHRLANHVYDHPYKSLMTVGVPLVGSIFAYQATNQGIQRSQQIMHTRIYGQGAVVVLLLASMGFHDFMQKRGRFVAEEEHAEEGQH